MQKQAVLLPMSTATLSQSIMVSLAGLAVSVATTFCCVIGMTNNVLRRHKNFKTTPFLFYNMSLMIHQDCEMKSSKNPSILRQSSELTHLLQTEGIVG